MGSRYDVLSILSHYGEVIDPKTVTLEMLLSELLLLTDVDINCVDSSGNTRLFIARLTKAMKIL